MRTNIEIDDALMEKALSLAGARTKREVVDQALRLLVRMKSQGQLLALRGKLTWDDDLERMRGGREA